MVIAVAGLCLQVDEDSRRVKIALGSVGPTIIRAREAEDQVSEAMESAGVWQDRTKRPDDAVIEEFAGRVAAAARPLDDVRGTAAYRRHACQVLARRALSWALDERALPSWL